MGREMGDDGSIREFWFTENLRYSAPHYRLCRIAGIVNAIARGSECDLLDVGCGPAALARLLDRNIRYFGIDIAIHQPAPNLFEADVVDGGLSGLGRTFDIVVASGFFEYVGGMESRIFNDIREVLRPAGTFVVSYINFEHIHRIVTSAYSNVRTIRAFRDTLTRVFEVTRCFPVSYNWRGTAPRRPLLQKLEMHFDVDVPVAGRFLGVEYVFLCSHRRAPGGAAGS